MRRAGKLGLAAAATAVFAALLSAQTPVPFTVVELDVAETATVRVGGKALSVELVSVAIQRDSIRHIIRDAKIELLLDGRKQNVSCGNYNLPVLVPVAGVQVDCPMVSDYVPNAIFGNIWNLHKRARLRLWPAGSSYLAPNAIVYPLRQRWFASATQAANEPVFVDGVEESSAKKIYYHESMDIGGAEGKVDVLSASDGRYIACGARSLPEFSKMDIVEHGYDNVFIEDSNGWLFNYYHLQSIEPDCVPGAAVKKGRKIGVLGKEGQSGGWSHLHFGIYTKLPDGSYGATDPYAFLWEANVRDAKPKLIAVARPHHLAAVGEAVELDGTKSWAVGGRIAQYEWQLMDGRVVKSSRATVRYSRPGSYSEILKITDPQGNVDYDFGVVQVVDAGSSALPPTIHAAYFPSIGLRPGQMVTFTVRSFGGGRGGEVIEFGDGARGVVHSDDNVDDSGKRYTLNPRGYAMITHSYRKPGIYLVKVSRDSAVFRLKVVVEP
jgi:murein DD-endopeptidase MepM/ murein hydrolase activator NlpD